jgi:hypothetical protein
VFATVAVVGEDGDGGDEESFGKFVCDVGEEEIKEPPPET